MSLFVAGCGAPTITRRIRDVLLRDPTTKSHVQSADESATAMGGIQSAVQSAAMDGVQSATLARVWVGACGFWPALRPIRQSAVNRRLWHQCRMGCATSRLGPAASPRTSPGILGPATAPALAA